MVISSTSILTALARAGRGARADLAGRPARTLRRYRAAPATGRLLAVQDMLALDPRRRLYLVKCDQRRVLLLVGGAQDVVVGWLDAERDQP